MGRRWHVGNTQLYERKIYGNRDTTVIIMVSNVSIINHARSLWYNISDHYFGPIFNKKVLLRERKRLTARRVASLCCPKWVPPRPGYPPGQGIPPPARVPPATPPGGVPPGQGTPWQGYPPGQGTPRLDLAGYPPPPLAAPWHSGKCCKALWDTDTPPPPLSVLRTRAVIKTAQ